MRDNSLGERAYAYWRYDETWNFAVKLGVDFVKHTSVALDCPLFTVQLFSIP